MTLEESISQEKQVERILEKINKFPQHLVYYALKEYGVTNIRIPTVDITKACLVLNGLKVKITVNLLEYLHSGKNVYTLLHRLGDYNVLTLVKDGRKRLRFVVNPIFLRYVRIPEGFFEYE